MTSRASTGRLKIGFSPIARLPREVSTSFHFEVVEEVNIYQQKLKAH